MSDPQSHASDEPRVRAPDFTTADGWLNTDHPLTIRELRGQVVLLDFWTYCCVNCMHVFPDLKYLEEKYANQPFVVIGVHSGKFSQEKNLENIRQAVLRHNLTHPIAVDSDRKLWDAYGVRAWPTFVLIDPLGYFAGTLSGEGHREKLDRAISELLAEHRIKGTLAAAPLKFTTEQARASSVAVLAFPGKILADPQHDRLFISDTNHHRIVVTDPNGVIQTTIGAGTPDLRDGDYATACFRQPQGLALAEDGQTLYVADTENHALRAVDLKARRVTTLAGTGTQSYDYRANGFGPKTALSTPWALACVGRDVYIAMAGLHQIWRYDGQRRRISIFAGTAQEGARDGVNRNAFFAQPSGIATDGKRLYVADAESSSIRTIELRSGGRTKTLAGSGGLFDFGLQDGVGAEARFQHPLGVALWHDELFVADTFNHVIRRVDLASGQVSTWLGTGQPGVGTPEQIQFYEPGGLAVGGDTLYIADTNNQRIVAVDIPTQRVRVLDVQPATDN